jgi:NAD-dependent deacetylase
MEPSIVVLSGAGISAESGISTFRDANGLWENHDIMEVASIDGWHRNPRLVLDFYNQRRRQLAEVQPNAGHLALAELGELCDLTIVTQNVDDLHERAGSRSVVHLHGELLKVRSERIPKLIYPWTGDLQLGDCCEQGHQLRPHIVWFGEEVPAMFEAARLVGKATHIIIVGTSLQVYPAAGLVSYAPPTAEVFYIDPRPASNYELARVRSLEVLAEPATTGLPKVVENIRRQLR